MRPATRVLSFGRELQPASQLSPDIAEVEHGAHWGCRVRVVARNRLTVSPLVRGTKSVTEARDKVSPDS